MTVAELIKKEKYWSPVHICGGETHKEFFYEDFPKTKEARELAMKKYGNLNVSYYYYTTDYYCKLWRFVRNHSFLRPILRWVAFRLNPQILMIETY